MSEPKACEENVKPGLGPRALAGVGRARQVADATFSGARSDGLSTTIMSTLDGSGGLALGLPGHWASASNWGADPTDRFPSPNRAFPWRFTANFTKLRHYPPWDNLRLL
jgi:hypothetical protein